MIEMSAAPSSATALPGAVIAAGLADASGEGAQIADFSTVLASSTGSGTASVQPATTAPAADLQPAMPGKNGTSGNPTGKILPTGKLPVEPKVATEDDTAPKEASADPSATSEAAPSPPVAVFDAVAAALPMMVQQAALVAPETSQGPASRKGAARAPSADTIITARTTPGLAAMAQQDPAQAITSPQPLATSDTKPTPISTTPVSDKTEHKPTQAGVDLATVAAAPVISPRQDTMTALPTDMRATPAPATFSAVQNTDGAFTQDIATLVDRITEARAAAAPHAVRAALMHEDFGAVSLTFRADDSHMHVTLGSADPGFAPAVHAAAATASAGDDTARRDAQSQQGTTQQQDTTTQNGASSQQQASRERTAANERAARDQALRQPTDKADRGHTSSAPQPRRSGIYA